jgi:membrane fusion protein (multidrug efflux system)
MRRITPLLAAALLALAGCRGGDDALEVALATPVTLERVQAVDLSIRIEATGELLAVHHAEIAAEVGGRITEILVDDGGSVERDGKVLTIDPERRALSRDSARARVDEARASLREQDRAFARVSELRGRKVSSQTKVDQAETELALARSRLAAAVAELGVAERALNDATVRAPFSGRIARRFVSRGEFVSVGDKLIELVSLDPIEVEFHLTEADSSRAARGQGVAIRVAPYPDEVFGGQVTVVAPTIDPESRTLRLKARVDNSDGRLRPGLFARIDLGVATRDQVAMIPEEAILQRADGAVVFRSVADERVERVVIETGAHHEGLVEVVKGLRSGDQIVTRGQFRLTDGQRVSVRTPGGARVEEAIPDLAGTAQ